MEGRLFIPIRGAAGYARASYSLYVMHLPVAIFAFAMLLPFASDRLYPSLVSLVAYLAAIGALMVLGWGFAWMTEFRTPWLRGALDRAVPGGKQSRIPPLPASLRAGSS